MFEITHLVLASKEEEKKTNQSICYSHGLPSLWLFLLWRKLVPTLPSP